METILITGATGLIGQEIVAQCHQKGINVNYLTTSKSKLSQKENYKGFYWNPKQGEIDTSCFEGVKTIINLVGASVSKRWTNSYKKEIIESRTQTAKLIANVIKSNNFEVEHIISASAIGIYPSSFEKIYDETNEEISSSFLGQVVSVWEDAVDEFKSIDIKVSKVRIGIVLSNKGGALVEIIKPIKLGAGAAFGNGKQWQSWIHISDLAKLFLHIKDQKLEGIFNGVASNPVTNAELTKQAAKVLKRPLILPNIPKFAMKLALGDMHIILYESQNVRADNVIETGFEFEFENIDSALKDLLIQ